MYFGLKDEYNTLRISNIFYSLSFFALLLKIGSFKKLDYYLKPRQTTFGIYLVHQILIIRVLPEIFKWSSWNHLEFTVTENLAYIILRFLKTRFKWSIGS